MSHSEAALASVPACRLGMQHVQLYYKQAF
jgi:hypothetical protein